MLRSFFLIILGLFASPASALVDCSSSQFRDIVELADSVDFDCQLILSEPVAAAGQQATIRALRHAGLAANPHDGFGAVAVATAAEAYGVWGAHADAMGLVFPNATILITDAEDPTGAFEGSAFTKASLDVLPEGVSGECFLRVNSQRWQELSADGIDEWLLVYLFRCVQGASYPKHFAAIPPEVRAWWVNGQSLLMAGLVRPLPAVWDQAGQAFASAIGTTPLHELRYGATPFFAHLWNEGGALQIGALILALEEASSADLQLDAIEAAVSPDGLRRFATQAADGLIFTPDGYPFPAIDPGEAQLFEDSGNTSFASKPGTIEVRLLEFTKGGYYLTTGIEFQTRNAGGGGWQDIPEEVRPSFCEDVTGILFARFVTGSYAPANGYPLNVLKFEECFECTTLPERNKCMAGRWSLRRDHHLDWLRGRGMEGEVRWDYANGSVVLELSPEGKARWIANGLEVGATITSPTFPDLLTYVNVTADGEDSGVWSTDGTTMHYCETNAAIAFDIEVRNAYLETQLADVGIASSMEAEANCDAQFLFLSYTGPQDYGDFAPQWVFDRVK